MDTWIALFRGINVGGRNMLPMAKLKSDLESLKLRNVRTWIQSGNVVFDSTARGAAGIGRRIARKMMEQHGFSPQVLILSREELRTAIESNPFPAAVSDPKSLHFFFLAEPASQADLKALDEAKTSSEAYELTDRVFYLHAPAGVGRSKLAASAEKRLGVVTTARNYRTVDKLYSMAMQD